MMSEDVAPKIAPHIIMTDTGGPVGVWGAGRTSSGSVELGRRLLAAARQGDTAAVLDLMAKGAPFSTDWLGTSPLHLAAGGAHADTCAVLLRAGVSRDARTKVERTPLHLAAHAGHAAVARLLLDNGAAVDCRDMLRMTPLHWAAARGHGPAAAALLAAGADPLAVSKFHKTPRALAAARGDAAMLRAMDEALRAREAAASVSALAGLAENATEIPAAEQQRALESIERLQETVKPTAKPQPTLHTEGTKIEFEKSAEGRGGGGGAALLRKHGITLLPHDDSTTVLNAIQSGRTVVLSDAGKLMLKESVAVPPTPAPAPAPAGVILTAAPARSPPRPGVKIFTLNNKLLAVPKENKAPVKKIKFVNLPSESKLLSAGKLPLKAKERVRPAGGAAAVGGARPAGGAAGGARPALKIVMHKAYKGSKDESLNGVETAPVAVATELTKVQHGSVPAGTAAGTAGGGAAGTAGGGAAGTAGGGPLGTASVLCVPQEFLSSNSTQYLRAQLLAAHQTIQQLNNKVRALQDRLAAYEPV